MIILEEKTTCKKILDELADEDGFIKGIVDINLIKPMALWEEAWI